jgi:hypothetical protein
MSQGLDSGDRKLLIGAGILLVILVLVSTVISPPRLTGSSEIPSSYSPSWTGAKGAFLLLQELGFDVTRWEHPPTELPLNVANQVLILAQPALPPSEEERSAIYEFVENGGRIIATGASASQFLPEASKFDEGDPFESNQVFHALLPSPLVRGARQISMIPPIGWNPRSLRQIVVYGNEDTAAVVTYPFGKGEIIWWATATPLTNGSILDSGNLAFFLNCIGSPAKVHVFWDEYFHGERGSLLSFFARTPLLWGLAQFGLIFLAILLTHSRRFGPIRQPELQSRLSPLEFVATLGDLYNSAHVASFALQTSYQRFRFVFTRKLGLPAGVSVTELARSTSLYLGWKEDNVAELLSQCEKSSGAKGLSSREALKLIQELHDFSRRLEIPNQNIVQRSEHE